MPKQKTYERFALIQREILKSKCWKQLTNSARVIYLHLKGEYNGANADKLILPYGQMKGIVGHASFWRGIKLLEGIGFIDIVFRGGIPKPKEGRLEREPSIYKLSERWRLREKTLPEYQEEFKQKRERAEYRKMIADEMDG